MEERVVFAPSRSTSSRVLVGQEYFWSLVADDPDPTTYAMRHAYVISGALERPALQRSLRAIVAAHGVFRTRFDVIERELYQTLLPPGEAAACELGFVDRSPLAETEWQGEIRSNLDDLVARDFGIEPGHVLRARLIAVAPERHLLVVASHHVSADGASHDYLMRRLFELYEVARRGDEVAEPAPLQLVDVAESLARWSRSSTGRARATYWRERLHDAPPVELPLDAPRDRVDRSGRPGRHGIYADPMYPPERVELSPSARAAVGYAARTHKVTVYTVFVAALAWLLRERSGQDDLSIETTFDLRISDPALSTVMGLLTRWTLLRIDASGCSRFASALARVRLAVDEMKKHGPIDDYYSSVPPFLRRVVFNYLPNRLPATYPTTACALGVQIHHQPFPPWKRPWELHLTVFGGGRPVLWWTGNQHLFRQDTVRGLLGRYVEILESAALPDA